MASASLVRRGMGNQANGVRTADPSPDPDGLDGRQRLLPATTTKRKRHHVRVQGQLVLVQSASVADLRAAASAAPSSPDVPAVPTVPAQLRAKPGGCLEHRDATLHPHSPAQSPAHSPARSPRRRRTNPDTDTDADDDETAARDRQRRGYGIGGAGNIRRPTEVIHFYSSGHDRTTRPRWHWTNLLGLRKKGDTERTQPSFSK